MYVYENLIFSKSVYFPWSQWRHADFNMIRMRVIIWKTAYEDIFYH